VTLGRDKNSEIIDACMIYGLDTNSHAPYLFADAVLTHLLLLSDLHWLLILQ